MGIRTYDQRGPADKPTSYRAAPINNLGRGQGPVTAWEFTKEQLLEFISQRYGLWDLEQLNAAEHMLLFVFMCRWFDGRV